jgi:putative membrane protein
MIWFPHLQMGGGMGGWPAFGVVGPVIGLLVLVAILYALFAVVNGQQGVPTRDHRGNDGMETLRERYARGEIDDEEFEERARRLRED